tara:strand:- start:2110 stop:2289 length:180 start_codon:yes stop_codon:yes gene_type:complete
MKYYDCLKAVMDTVQQQIVLTMKSEHVIKTLKEVKHLCQGLSFTNRVCKGRFEGWVVEK